MCVCALDWVEKPGKEIAAKGEEQDTRETIAKIVQPATMRCVCAAVCVCVSYVCVCAFVLAKIVARKIELELQQRQGGSKRRQGDWHCNDKNLITHSSYHLRFINTLATLSLRGTSTSHSHPPTPISIPNPGLA